MAKFVPCLPLLCALLPAVAAAQTLPVADSDQLDWLGKRIFQNECNSRPLCLTSWNAGEDFPSLGIGHFIWYRNAQQGAFTETFPALLGFLRARGVALPAWLRGMDPDQPWPDRDSFLAALHRERLSELRRLLQDTQPLQAEFIVQRFARGLDGALATLPAGDRAGIEAKVTAIMRDDARYGPYALIDYVNFKGEGSNPAERYAGHGWGLLQVLRQMPDDSATPLRDFVAAARTILARRVAAAPPERNEARWLKGWNARLDTYLPGH